MVTVGESLVREIARLRQDLEARSVIVNDMREFRAESGATKALDVSKLIILYFNSFDTFGSFYFSTAQETRRELEEEKSSKVAIKDKLSTTESQLRQTRVRVTKMDRQLREAEATITSLTATVKSLEDQVGTIILKI